MKPRILLLSYAFPPAALPEALLSAKRMGNLADFDVDVISMNPAGSSIRLDPSFDSYVDERFGRVERLGIPSVLKRLFSRKTGAIFELPGLLHIMNRKALRSAIRSKPECYAAIVTWSQWHSIHLVGLALKRRYAGIPWIAHFSDPWSDNPFVRLGGAISQYSRYLESRVYSAADLISFTSRETIDLVMSGARERFRAKAFELPHAFEPDFYPATVPRRDGPLVLRSLGNFYGPRSPEPLFRALDVLRERNPGLLGKLRVELIGSVPERFRQSSAFRNLPPGIVQLRPPIDYRMSLALMRSADLLLTIDAPFENSVFLPSKLVDYIGAERPIFGITPRGTSSRIIGELGGWFAAPDDTAAIAAALERALTYVEANRDASWGDQRMRRTYEAAEVGAHFNKLIRGLSGGPTG